jgi:hypothetical protein
MQASKSVTAKLLATENITVVQDKVRTASFDVKNRVLTLPLWADVSTATEDHLIGHEVGHALYTPLEGWHDAVCDKGANYKSFLNVVEDARIEKLIQRKYPGLRTLFIKSYRTLLAEGFFGGTVDAINDMGLIDRINTYFKCGVSAGVEFSAEEKQWLPRIDSLETWEEVVKVTDELFEFCKQELEEQRQREEEEAANQEEEEGDATEDDSYNDNFDFSDDEEESDEDDTESSAADTDGEGDESSEDDEGQQGEAEGSEVDDESDDDGESPAQTREGGKNRDIDPDLPSSKTDDNLRDAIDQMAEASDRRVTNFTVQAPEYSKHVISYKRILDEIRGIAPIIGKYTYAAEDESFIPRWQEQFQGQSEKVSAIGDFLFGRWQSVNKKAVNHMVKEFEMRKQAGEFARASTAKTGVIDTIKMNNYHLTDDIFKKVTILPEGKNHAFVMFLDMSGSMAEDIYATVEQTLLLASFCRQINVPFRVYGFTDRFSDRWASRQEERTSHEYYVEGGISLMELFSNEQSKSEFTTIAKAMLAHYVGHGGKGGRKYDAIVDECWKATGFSLYRLFTHTRCFDLGGTPLDSAIMIGIPLINEFRAQHRTDIMNVVFLTDGASHEMECRGNTWRNASYGYNSYASIVCPYNNKTYKARQLGSRMTSATELFMEMMKDCTGANMIGYFITKQTKNSALRDHGWLTGRNVSWDKREELWKEMREDGFISADVIGYDDFFMVGNKSLQIVENKMDEIEAGEVSKARLRTMFKKAQTGGKKSRKMLNDIVKRCA